LLAVLCVNTYHITFKGFERERPPGLADDVIRSSHVCMLGQLHRSTRLEHRRRRRRQIEIVALPPRYSWGGRAPLAGSAFEQISRDSAIIARSRSGCRWQQRQVPAATHSARAPCCLNKCRTTAGRSFHVASKTKRSR